MIDHLSMKPTGWFQIGWSAEIPPGGVKPMKYFGEELVAFRTQSGRLSVLEPYCVHMGTHLGYGGKIRGECIACPYHGWEFDADGANTKIPYEDKVVKGKQLKKWHVLEQHEMILLWHDPAGGPPREGWTTDLFDHDKVPANVDDFYPAYVNGAIVYKPGEPIHPQITQENSCDTAHFEFTHGAPRTPKLVQHDGSTPVWKSSMNFHSPKTEEVTITTYARNPGIGMSYFVFHHHGGSAGPKYGFNRRLILTATPVDDETSDLRVTYFFPRDPNSPDLMPQFIKDEAAHTVELFEEDARIWRHQRFVQHPVFARADVAGYTELRKWSNQFYEIEGAPVGPMKIRQ
ncbi:Rieske 2Fe-2S domain-containing protein [Myxococcota bacterium]|jgi:3-ketosteroid 9alpha-monooxygenase subunit A|nr:Rieske 2Fe-2S domain-containing protein [Myxococcota bacterium]